MTILNKSSLVILKCWLPPKTLEWDGENMQFTNIGPEDHLKVIESDRLSLKDGRPTFDTKLVTLNALETAGEYIRHSYREGWSLSPLF